MANLELNQITWNFPRIKKKKKREVTLTKVPIKATDAPVQTQQHTP